MDQSPDEAAKVERARSLHRRGYPELPWSKNAPRKDREKILTCAMDRAAR